MPPQENYPALAPPASPKNEPQSCNNLDAPVLLAQLSEGPLKNDHSFVNKGYLVTSDIDLGCNSSKKNNNSAAEDVGDGGAFDFDELLPHIGQFGRYQIALFFMMIPFACFVAWVYFTQIFITLTPEKHWCWVPELENLTREQRIHLAIPKNSNFEFDKCRMYAVNYTDLVQRDILEPDPSWPTIKCSDGWEYDHTDVPYKTIASELNWVCENDSLATIAQAVFFVGAILGGLVFGWIADRKGRIPALVGTNVVGAIAGISTAYCSSFTGFCACRFFVGMAFDNCFTMMYILVLEYVGPKWRTFVANMSIAIFFTVAATGLPWLALWLADWRTICLVTSAPLLIALVTPFLVPESARWLASQGKVDKAVCILRKFERINGKSVDEKYYTQFTTSCMKQQKEEENMKSYSVLDLFKTPRLRRITILLIVIWMSISLVFDGHVRNVGSLGFDVFLTFSIASFTELPADTFLTLVLDRWGRRWLACGTMVASGVFSLAAIAVPVGITSASLAIIGRFAVNISYNIGLQYAAELLPTVVRAQGVALIHIMGYVASIVAPFIVYLGNIDSSLPFFILGIIGIIGGLLSLFLPETLDQELPQTLHDGEEFGKDQKFFEFPCMKVQPKSVEEPKEYFRRTTSLRLSASASTRGAVRSSMILRGSTRSRKSTKDTQQVV